MVNGSLNMPMRGKISSSLFLLSFGGDRYAPKKPYGLNRFFSGGICAATILGALVFGGKSLDGDIINTADIGAKADEVLECFPEYSLGKIVKYIPPFIGQLTFGSLVKLSDSYLEANLK